MHDDRIAVCPICKQEFPVNPKFTITLTGRIFAFGHHKPDGEMCMCNGAVIPNYVARDGDVRPIGEA